MYKSISQIPKCQLYTGNVGWPTIYFHNMTMIAGYKNGRQSLTGCQNIKRTQNVSRSLNRLHNTKINIMMLLVSVILNQFVNDMKIDFKLYNIHDVVKIKKLHLA